jgi:hypothetical protein
MLRVVCLRSDRLFLPFEGIRGMTFAKQGFFVPQGSPTSLNPRTRLGPSQRKPLKIGTSAKGDPLTQGFNNPGPV